MEIKLEEGFIEVDLENVSVKDINELISKMSVELEVPNSAKTLLYSGRISELDIRVLDMLGDVEGVRMIRDTEMGKILEGEEFAILIKKAVENDLKNGVFELEIISSSLSEGELITLNDSILGGRERWHLLMII